MTPPCAVRHVYIKVFFYCVLPDVAIFHGPVSIPGRRSCCSVGMMFTGLWITCVTRVRLGTSKLSVRLCLFLVPHDDIKEMLGVHIRGYRFKKEKERKKTVCTLPYGLVWANF